MKILFSQMSPSWRHFLIIALAVAGAYFAALSGDFVWDDSLCISSNTFVHDWKNIPLIFTRQYLTSPDKLHLIGQEMIGAGEASYRPVVTLSYFWDYSVWKLNPFGYRLTSLILHILCAWMVYLFLGFFLKNRSALLWASLVFALHPVQAEAVMYPSMREDLLAALFYLITLVLYVNVFHRGQAHIKSIYPVMLISYGLALFSKEMAVTLPLMLIIIDLFLKKERFTWMLCFRRRYWGFYAVTAVYLYIWMFGVGGRSDGFAASYPGGSFYTNILNMLKVAGIYVDWIFIAPWTIKPTLMPGADFIVTSFWSPGVAPALVILLTLALAILMLRRRMPLISLAAVWVGVTLLPVLNIIPMQNIYAPRFWYLPMAGVALAFGLIIADLFDKKKPVRFNHDFLTVALGVLIAFYALLVYGQHFRAKDEPAFRRALVQDYPLHMSARVGLAHVYRNQIIHPRLAIEQFLIARAIDPSYLMNSIDLVEEYLKIGEVDNAVAVLDQALARDSSNTGLRDMKCVVLANAGRFPEAASCYEDLLHRDPQFIKAWRDLHACYMLQGDQRRAAATLLRVLGQLRNG